VIGELSARPDLRQAGLSGIGATLGLLLGIAGKLTIAFAMLGLYALDRLGFGS
jgi:hypothetical protein